MEDTSPRPSTAFQDSSLLASGPLEAVALAVKASLEADPTRSPLVFDDQTGKVIDLDLRGTAEEVVARLAPPPSPEPRGPGRPKLGVVAREVTLLPRHWEWLNAQPGGASVALRRLVEEARRSGRELKREAQERTYRVMAALAGDSEGFEEALRALYASDLRTFTHCMRGWPRQVREYILRMGEPCFR